MPTQIIPDLTNVANTRRAIADLNVALTDNTTRLAQTRASRDALAGVGGDPAQLQALGAEIGRLREQQRQLSTNLAAANQRLREFIEQALTGVNFEERVKVLQGNVPVALLPVRLETRFFKNNTELHLRIYPDQIHAHHHEPELTPPEVEAGRWYWQQRWQGVPTGATNGAWLEVAKKYGALRAAWVVRALTPANLAAIGDPAGPQFPQPALKAEAWTRPAQAVALPDRWVAIGYQGTAEVFRKWGNGVPDTLALSPQPDPADIVPPPPDDKLPVDDAMRWVVDYDKAVEVGMAITVTDAELSAGATLARGLSRLVVLGVDWTLTPEQTASTLNDLLQAHLYTDELSFLSPGTPTNNTGVARSGLDRSPEAQIALYDPDTKLVATAAVHAAQALCRALGLPVDPGVARAPGATLREQLTASHMLNALWRATLGYYLDEMGNAAGDDADANPNVSDRQIDQARDHVVRFLRPGGPFPALRAGKQPYGVLPVVAPSYKPAAQDDFTGNLFGLLNKLRPFWLRGLSRVPRLATAANRDQVEQRMLDMLRTTPLSATARFRRAYGSVFTANAQGINAFAELQADVMSKLVGPHLGWLKPPRISEFVSDMRSYALPVPWVQDGGVSESEGLKANYIMKIAATLRGGSDAREALSGMEDSDNLLQTFLAHAALEEIDHSANKLVNLHHRLLGVSATGATRRLSLRGAEMTFVEPPPARQGTTTPQTAPVYTRRELSRVVLPRINPNLTVAEHISTAMKSGALTQPELANLAAFLASLDALRVRPSAELERAFIGALDACSHRLDAWYTSLATRRLTELRQSRPAGVYVGGYGWVEDLKPDRQPDSLGYLHAPSLAQAAAAAILRSGHLSHQTGEATGGAPFNIDMSSQRVRTALALLNGAAQGQSLAALLGYRFERRLRERDIRLARFILPFRKLAPLRPNDAALPAGQPVENIAARDVVDGVTLLERWRNEKLALLNALSPAPGAGDRDALRDELDRLAGVLDAASDVLTAEAVYQTLLGNYERAGAAMATLDRQERPADPAVVRTPRTGRAYVQRVMVLLGSDVAPGGWAALIDARARAEPRLNAWAGALLGAPARIRFAARVMRRASPDAPPVEIRRLTLAATALSLSPLALVFAAAPGGQHQPSELEERLAQAFAAQVSGGDANTFLELLDEPPAGANLVGLGALLVVLDWVRGLLTDRRAADARDLAVPSDLPGDGLDVAEIAARADALKAEVQAAVAELDGALASNTAAALSNALLHAAALAVPDAWPPRSPASALADQATAARAHLQAVLDEIARAEQGVAGQALAPQNAVAHHAGRITLVLGKAFPALPRFMAGNAGAVTASLKDRAALCANEPLNLSGWLRQMALVRPGVEVLSSVLSGAALLGGLATGPAQFAVAQLPHRPGQRWLALPDDSGATPEGTGGEVALLAHVTGPLDATKPLAGLVCDEWTEMIPNDVETTGVSFHYDAPGARPPQAIILAVPPDPTATQWELQTLLDTVDETMRLAQLRLAGPKEVEVLHGNLLPALYLPQNFTKDVPSVNLMRLRDLYKSRVRAVGVLGKEIL